MADPRELMARYQDGDAGAFRELYAQVAPRLLGYLVKMARSRPVADDLLQQTFLKVHRARAAYIHGTDPLPWIYSIAHRTFLDEVRKKKRAIVNVSGDADGELPEAQAGITGDAVGAGDEPVDPEKTKAALDALAKLPPQQREAVVLTKLEGKSVAEAAEIAGTTVGAMKVRAHRGYEALRKLLGAVVDSPTKRTAAAGFIAGALLGSLALGTLLAIAAVAIGHATRTPGCGTQRRNDCQGRNPKQVRGARSAHTSVSAERAPCFGLWLRPLPPLRRCVPPPSGERDDVSSLGGGAL